jgi:hypothetical protein
MSALLLLYSMLLSYLKRLLHRAWVGKALPEIAKHDYQLNFFSFLISLPLYDKSNTLKTIGLDGIYSNASIANHFKKNH